MSYPPNHWLVRLLHRILSGANSFTCRSIQRWLYLWSILIKRIRGRKPPSDGNASPLVISAGSSAVQTIYYGSNDCNPVTTVCPSMQPRSPNMHEMSCLAALPAASANPMLHAHPYTQDLGTVSLVHSEPSVSSLHSVVSAVPSSVTCWSHERGLLRPSSYATGPHRPPSPALSSAPSQTDGYHFSDKTANVATPAGEVALPETGGASLLAGTLYQTTPEWISDSRYQRNVHIPKTESTYKLQPLQLAFPHGDQPLPSEWIPLTHPEGGLYFYHKDRKIFTDAYLYDPDMLLHTETFIHRIEGLNLLKAIPPDAELVLKVTPDEENGGIKCGYYFVHHQTRGLFWLEDFEADGLLFEIQGLSSAAHLKHEIESQYWKHWELFPNNYTVSQDIIDELSEILLYASGDSLTSAVSTAPYSSDNLNKMLNLVKQVKPGKRNGHSACYIGRLMSTFTYQKFLHFHGQNGARLCRDQSLHETSRKRSLLITVLSPILFSAPDVHLRALGDIWVDNIIGHVPWNEFRTKLSNDWNQFTLYGTVLLNANVAFLAIQSVDTGVPQRSAAQLCSYGSIVVSVGSIILGLLLERQNRRETATAAANFLSRMTRPSLELETLAIMYSLPYALLMWGMLSFLGAFCFMCFDNTSIPTRAIMGTISAVISVLIFWSIWATWESGEHYWLALFSRISQSCKSALRKSEKQPATNTMFARRSCDSTPSVTFQV